MKTAGLLILLSMLFLTWGCSRAVPVNIMVTGTGSIRGGEPGDIEPPLPPPAEPDMSWAEGEITATGYGAPPETAVSEAQARLMAKQAAKTDALRNLAERIEGVRIGSETTVRNFVTQNDEIRSQVEGYVTGAQKVSERELDDGSWEVRMSIDLSPLARIIPYEETTAEPPPTRRLTGPPTTAQARLMAERAAMADAYRKIMEQLKGVHIKSETTVEDFIARDDRIRSRVEGIVRGARVVDTRRIDGVVEVDMRLVHPDIRQVIK